MRLLRQSTAFTFRAGPFLDSTDGVTAETALSIAQADIQISKAGGAFAQTSASPTTTHDVDGWYQCPLTSTDTNTLGTLTVQIVMAGALVVWEHFMVVTANYFDSVCSTDLFDVSVVQFNGTNGTFASGRPEVNASHWGGTAVASAVVRATLEQILGTAVTEGAAGRVAAAFQTLFNVASPVLTAASVNQTGDSFARIGAPVGASISADIASVKTDTGNLVTRITSTLFSGITSLAQWLGALAGKQVADTTARNEIRASGAGSGTFDETTDSQEAIRDNMGTAQTGDSYARIGAPAGASVSADIASIKTDTGNLVSRITATLFSGITSLAQWLGALAGKQVADTTARTEIRATGAGSGTFDETTDSQEALRDRGDAAWVTATGFSTLTEAGVRTALGVATANIDTQLGNINSKTTNLPADPADASDVAAAIASAQSAITALLPSSLSSGRMRVDVEAINTATAAAIRLALASGQIIPFTVDHTAFTATTTEFESDDLATATADFWNTRLVLFTSGALAGQIASISDYARVGSNGHFTISAVTSAPADNVTGVIL